MPEIRNGNIHINVPQAVVDAAKKEIKDEEARKAYWATHADLDPEGWISRPGSQSTKGKRFAEPWRGSGAQAREGVRTVISKRGKPTVQVGLTIEEALAMIRKR